MSETTRTITGKSSVPAGTSATGTVTALAADNAILQVSGGVYADFAKHTENGYRNIWIYCTVEHKIAKILTIAKNSTTSFLLYTDRVLPFVFNSPFTLVVADLVAYAVKNNGGGNGEFDGATVEDGDAVNSIETYHPDMSMIQKEAKVVNGTGTSIVITETR